MLVSLILRWNCNKKPSNETKQFFLKVIHVPDACFFYYFCLVNYLKQTENIILQNN